jgi:glycyl-tRNA synthetase beta chain
MTMRDILFEIGTEELPSQAVKTVSQALLKNIILGLEKHGLVFVIDEEVCLATPRRIAVRFQVESRQPDQTVLRQGPTEAMGFLANGAPSKALLGFANACGVDMAKLEMIDTPKGRCWAFKSFVPGQDTCQLLPEILQHAVLTLPIAKPMRWGKGEHLFLRPVHWVVLLADQEVIELKLLGCETGRNSFGHRFHHPSGVQISSPAHYENTLLTAQVIVDFHQRRQKIERMIEHAAEQVHGVIASSPDLLDEVTAIVEWPVALCVSFDAGFLDNVPTEALVAAMQVHQKCFPIYTRDGRLLPYFIAVSNIESQNVEQVIAGNERVMRARLSDAAFFYAQDKQKKLSDYVTDTTQVVFQEKLGTLHDKAQRIGHLLMALARDLNLNPIDANRAALLSKADLMTGMVGEFPELEGLMGYYYALQDQESVAVAEALKEQYLPRFSGDALPKTMLGQALSLADRLDTLAGIFAIGLKPTAVKDPFKLRRHALAVVRLLKAIHAAKPISLQRLIQQAFVNYKDIKNTHLLDELHNFILDRLPASYQDTSVDLQLIVAVRTQQQDDLYDFDQRVLALQTFRARPEAAALSAACKRVNRLLQSVVFEDTDFLVDKRLLEKEVEKELLFRIERLEIKIKDFLSPAVTPGQQEYRLVLADLADFKETVDAFFDQVMVMVDDEVLKRNRLFLLARLQKLFLCVADISMLK